MICRGCGWLVEGEVCPKCARCVNAHKPLRGADVRLDAMHTDDAPRQVKVYDSLLSRLMPWLLGVFLPLALLLTVLSVYVVRIDYSPVSQNDGVGRIRYEAAIVGMWKDADVGAVVCFDDDNTGYIEMNGEKKPFIYVVMKDKIYIYYDAKMAGYSFCLARGKLELSTGQQKYLLGRIQGGVDS